MPTRRGGEGDLCEDRGPSHSPGACSSPSPPQASSRAHTNLASVVQNLLSRPTSAREVPEWGGKTVCRRRGKALKRCPHCVKRACQSIFVSAVEMYFPRGRVPECVWPCVWRVPMGCEPRARPPPRGRPRPAARARPPSQSWVHNLWVTVPLPVRIVRHPPPSENDVVSVTSSTHGTTQVLSVGRSRGKVWRGRPTCLPSHRVRTRSLRARPAVEAAGVALRAVCIPVLYVRVHNRHICCATYVSVL